MENLQSLREGVASGRLQGQRELKVSDDLQAFPMEILALAESLELLVLSGNKLSALPPEFAQLKHLKIVFFNNNLFTSFPAVLAECPELSMISFKSNQIRVVPEGVLSPSVRWLILTDNQITDLPKDIGRLERLQKLMLAGNKLRSLPDDMRHCKRLELIRLSANQLTELPSWLLSLPRLSWLAYAGNPLCNDQNPDDQNPDDQNQKGTALPLIKDSELALGSVLGQGASGIIYEGKWHEKTVAVKLFKGNITSDGLPIDEMRACIAAGHHPNLVNVLGKVSSQKAQAGLVFSFIAPEYQNLGGPPSLESCTRDTYGNEVTFSLQVVLNIVRGIASAIAHLHSRGITHGDLYAHNIFINDVGDSILGDFGAASFFPASSVKSTNDVTDAEQVKSLKSLESRAFGCLLEDLLDRCVVNENQTEEADLFKKIRDLQRDCLSETPATRPLFEEICAALT